MLRIRINGREERINIGCRTYLTLAELLQALDSAGAAVMLNGDSVRQQDHAKTNIRNGDSIAWTDAV